MNIKYPRPHKFDRLGSAAKRLSRVPRYALLISKLVEMSVEEPIELDTEAAVFWNAYSHLARNPDDVTGLLDDGLKATEAQMLGWHRAGSPDRREWLIRRWQMRLARDLLGALAFQMFCGPEGAGTSPPLFTVTDNLPEFMNRVFGRFEAAGAYVTARDKPIDGEYLPEDWRHIKAMNAYGLKHLVFSETEERLQFVDITTQAFFAAYWVCRWGDPEDRKLLWKWVPDPNTGSNEGYRELWTFVAEMPDEAVERERWEALLSPLYDGSLVDDQQRPIRATELIYRSWERMKDTPASQTFRNEFARIREGDQGEQRQQIARGLLFDEEGKSHFLPLCESPQGKEDKEEFEMGAPSNEDPEWDSRRGKQDNPLHPVRLSPYRLHRFCVTNAEYELFDPRHPARHKFKDFVTEKVVKVEDVSRHPVVDVSWYDAWCFAAWLGHIKLDGDDENYRVVLPSEAQWEYACRAGKSTPFTWSEGMNGDKVESKYCNFNGKYPWHRPGTPEAAKSPYCGRTVRVDGLDEDGTEFLANRWGFYHMHGNVWEWCEDWYGRDYYLLSGDVPVEDPGGPDNGTERVLRGGSWFYFGGDCRSGYRLANRPGFRSWYYGFRLAAVPAGSKQ